MKKQMIAAAIAAAVAAPAAMAGAPTVYGQINMSVDSVTNGYLPKWADTNSNGLVDPGEITGAVNKTGGMSVNSNASRIGVKGSEDLGNGLKAVYKMEWGVNVAGGKGATTGDTTLKDRNAYLGLAGSFGAVLLGRHDTPFKMAQPTDTFNDGYGDNKPMAGGLGALGAGGEVRAANVLAYVSPSFSGVKLVAAGVSPDSLAKNANLANGYSLAVMYGSKKKGLYLAGAYSQFDKYVVGSIASSVSPNVVSGVAAGKSYSEYRLAAQYTMGALMANVMYQNFDLAGGKAVALNITNGKVAVVDGSNWQANVAYTIGAATLKAKYSAIDYAISGAKDGSGFGLGVDYALGKKTTAYVEYVSLDKHASPYANKNLEEASFDTISVGLLHKF